MRTTVTLDPDVEALVKEKMRGGGITLKQVVNDALRDSLAPKPRVPVSFPTYDMGEPRIEVTKALQIASELEDAEILRKMGLRRPSKRNRNRLGGA